MRKSLLVLIVLVVIGYGAKRVSQAFKVKLDFSQRMEAIFDSADNTSVPSLKEDVLKEAARSGVEVNPELIQIAYVDTTDRNAAEKLVGRIGVQFISKRLTMDMHYTVRLFGFAWRNEYINTKLVQIQASMAPNPTVQKLLE